MTMLYLVRHGETLSNAEGRIQGHSNSPLNAEGRAQAQQIALAMAHMPLQAIYTSDLERAAQTAEAISHFHPSLTPQSDMRLREACFGEWEGLTLAEILLGWPTEAKAWQADSLRNRPPDGDTLEAIQTRVGQVIAEIIADFPHGDVAVVGHHGSIRAAIGYALGTSPAVSRHLRIDNCSLTTLTYLNDRFMLHCMNDTCHLRQSCVETT